MRSVPAWSRNRTMLWLKRAAPMTVTFGATVRKFAAYRPVWRTVVRKRTMASSSKNPVPIVPRSSVRRAISVSA